MENFVSIHNVILSCQKKSCYETNVYAAALVIFLIEIVR